MSFRTTHLSILNFRNIVGYGLAITFMVFIFLSFTRLEYQMCYLIGYILCTWFWAKHVKMTRFETFTVGIVWPMAMLYFVMHYFTYRLINGKRSTEWVSRKYAAQQRKKEQYGDNHF